MSWDMLAIGDFCRTGSGGTPSRKKASRYFGGNIPWVKSGELREGVITETEETITELAVIESSAKFIPKGALLVAMYGATIGRVAKLGINATSNQAVCHILPDESLADMQYMFYALQAQVPHWLGKGVGGAQPNISQEIIKNTVLPLPPLEEQRRIAAILDKAHRITLLQKDAKNAIELLPKSLFLSLFGDPRINPYSWPQYSLGELGRVVTGSTPPSSEHGMFEGTHPFVTPGDLGSGQASKRSLTEAGARRSRSVRKGSALVCCIGATIGKMDIAREDSAFNQQINAVEWGDSVIGEFGIEALRFIKDTISTAGASTTLPILKKSAFEKLRIPVPPIGLQRDYCRHLEVMSPCLARLQTAAQLGASLKQALMSKAFSGELLR
jgi:type I restriction enzyme S subunit